MKGNDRNIGDVVNIKDENIPPTKWLLVKIVLKYTGLDA